MNNKELAKKIVEAVNNETSNFDAIDRVEEILNTVIRIKESAEVKPDTDGIWVIYEAGTMEYRQIGTATTERDAYIKLAECWGMDYESELIDYLNDFEDATEEDFRLEILCGDGEGKVEYVKFN